MATKKTAAKKVEEVPQPETTRSRKLTVNQVAQQLHDGSRKWGTGRDRDTNLANLGYDLDEIRLAQRKIRAKELGSS